jgi:release factor glutamine methyltransferase
VALRAMETRGRDPGFLARVLAPMLADLTDIVRVLRDAESYLIERGVPNARRNAEWLLAHVLGCSSPELYLTPYRVIDRARLDLFHSLVGRRGAREPLQYILGTTEFMSLPFLVRPGVFIPRPDTEVLVEAVETVLRVHRGSFRPTKNGRVTVLDLCCGSGVIGVSLVCRLAEVDCVAVDVDADAVDLTRDNAARNGVESRVRAVEADAAEYLLGRPGPYDAIVCNPPYVPSGDIAGLLPELKDHEPSLGLDGGPDGLDFYRRLVPLLPPAMATGGIAAFEIGDTQARTVTSIFESASFGDVTVHRDYRHLDRVVTARR